MLKFLYIFLKTQYSLFYSSNIVQHFSFYRMKLFQLEKKVALFKSFFSRKNPKWLPFQSHQSHTCQIYFLSLIGLILYVP